MRKPLQGVWNIIRFNRQFYVLSVAAVVIIFFLRNNFNAAIFNALSLSVLLVICSISISLLVSWYIYDYSNLYKLTWIDKSDFNEKKIVNIHAGFDETSELLKNKFSKSEIIALDFYNPEKHTEISIRRARKAYEPYPDTLHVTTNNLPLNDNSTDKVFAILSAHEIRDDEERISFFKELYRVLKPSGQVIVTEHLRDTANFLAYNIGSFHFHSKATWLITFESAGLKIISETKVTPFITTFILEKNGTAF